MIGNCRTRIGIYVPRNVETTQWVLHKNVWAHIRLIPNSKYKLTIRWQENFPKYARALWDDKILSITTAQDPDGRKERLVLECELQEAV